MHLGAGKGVAVCTVVLVFNLVVAVARAASFPDPGSQDDVVRAMCAAKATQVLGALRTAPYKRSGLSLQRGKVVWSGCSVTDFLRAVWVAICPQGSILVTVTLCTYYFSLF